MAAIDPAGRDECRRQVWARQPFYNYYNYYNYFSETPGPYNPGTDNYTPTGSKTLDMGCLVLLPRYIIHTVVDLNIKDINIIINIKGHHLHHHQRQRQRQSQSLSLLT